LGRSTVLVVGLRRRIVRLSRLRIARLGVGRIVGLRVGRLRLRRCWGSAVAEDANLRRVGANDRDGGVGVVFSVVDRTRGPLKVLYVDRPDAFAGLASPDGSRGKSENVSRKDCPVNETECSDRLSNITEGEGASIEKIESISRLSPSGKPHDGQVGQPPNLVGNPRGEGTITEATSDEHSAHGKQVKD